MNKGRALVQAIDNGQVCAVPKGRCLHDRSRGVQQNYEGDQSGSHPGEAAGILWGCPCCGRMRPERPPRRLRQCLLRMVCPPHPSILCFATHRAYSAWCSHLSLPFLASHCICCPSFGRACQMHSLLKVALVTNCLCTAATGSPAAVSWPPLSQ